MNNNSLNNQQIVYDCHHLSINECDFMYVGKVY